MAEQELTPGYWTVETLRVHFEALRDGDSKFHAERDRRYAEVKAEQEKALKIKEEADKAALALASKIQEYKDEKANELRSQIEREQGERATKVEVNAAVEKVQAERRTSRVDGTTLLVGVLLVIAAWGTIVVILIAHP